MCGLCKEEIDIETQAYTNVRDFIQKRVMKELWCHQSCFNMATFQNKKEAARRSENAIEKAGEIFKKIGFGGTPLPDGR